MLPAGMSIYTEEKQGDLRQLNRDGLVAHIKEVLARYPEVAGAYLFGSVLDLVRPDSDIDIGLICPGSLYAQDVSWGMDAADKVAMAVNGILDLWGPHPFQITVLREENTSFVMRVLRRAQLIYCADAERVSCFLERVARLHDDVEPFRRIYFAARGMG